MASPNEVTCPQQNFGRGRMQRGLRVRLSKVQSSPGIFLVQSRAQHAYFLSVVLLSNNRTIRPGSNCLYRPLVKNNVQLLIDTCDGGRGDRMILSQWLMRQLLPPKPSRNTRIDGTQDSGVQTYVSLQLL